MDQDVFFINAAKRSFTSAAIKFLKPKDKNFDESKLIFSEIIISPELNTNGNKEIVVPSVFEYKGQAIRLDSIDFDFMEEFYSNLNKIVEKENKE